MSIWSSGPSVGHDIDGLEPPVGEVRSYASGWSNHYPTVSGDVELSAGIDLASIPVWCVPGHDNDPDEDLVGPWVRLSLYGRSRVYWSGADGDIEPLAADIILDETAARVLAADLLEWADRPKAHPVAVSEKGPEQ